MTGLWFYHLERSSIETALPPLLEKCLERGWRAVVRGGLPERLEALDQTLWTWKEETFLPHGLDGRGSDCWVDVAGPGRSQTPRG